MHPRYRQVSIPRVDIGGGLKATGAWIGSGPVVLVDTIDSKHRGAKSRLDLQKRIFIDALPGERTAVDVQALLNFFEGALGAPSEVKSPAR